MTEPGFARKVLLPPASSSPPPAPPSSSGGQIDKSSVNDEIDPALQAAYKAVFEVIRRIPPRSTDDYEQACENARVWRGVQAALDTFQLNQRPHIAPQVLLKQLCDEARDEASDLRKRVEELEAQRDEVLALTPEFDALGINLVVSLSDIKDIYAGDWDFS